MKKLLIAAVLLLTCAVGASYAGTIELPKTGQTTMYAPGDDGDLEMGVAWPDPRFTNDNGSIPITGDVVVDQLTGLMWARNANLIPSRDPGWDNDNTTNDGRVFWQHALDYVARLNNENYLGYADWRLPNLNEIESLMINAKASDNATWLISHSFTSVQSGYYWSSTTFAGYTECACFVNMETDGGTGCLYKSDYYFYVWPVRAGQCGVDSSAICLPKTGQVTCYYENDDGALQKGVSWPSPRFTDNGNGTVTDNLTCLIWLKNANPCGTSTWANALDYCNSLQSGMAGLTDDSIAGDWRLPNKYELRSLCDYSVADYNLYYPALPLGHPFSSVQSDMYWSSTTDAYSTGYVWVVNMGEGDGGNVSKSFDYLYLWPVRSGECWGITTLKAQCLQPILMRPFIFEQRCPWLILQIADDNHFDKGSTITLQGPSETAAGVVIDQNRTALKFWQFILVPICIDKTATVGQWNVAIETDVQGSEGSFKETIKASFQIQ